MKTVVLDTKNTEKKDAIYAIFSVDENGNEGLCAINNTPLVCTEKKNIAVIRKRALEVKEAAAEVKIVLVKFSNKEIIEEI